MYPPLRNVRADDLQQLDLSRQISAARVNNESLFAALRQRVSAVERDLEEVYKEADAATGERLSSRTLAKQATDASSHLDFLSRQLHERLKQVQSPPTPAHPSTLWPVPRHTPFPFPTRHIPRHMPAPW